MLFDVTRHLNVTNHHIKNRATSQIAGIPLKSRPWNYFMRWNIRSVGNRNSFWSSGLGQYATATRRQKIPRWIVIMHLQYQQALYNTDPLLAQIDLKEYYLKENVWKLGMRNTKRKYTRRNEKHRRNSRFLFSASTSTMSTLLYRRFPREWGCNPATRSEGVWPRRIRRKSGFLKYG